MPATMRAELDAIADEAAAGRRRLVAGEAERRLVAQGRSNDAARPGRDSAPGSAKPCAIGETPPWPPTCAPVQLGFDWAGAAARRRSAHGRRTLDVPHEAWRLGRSLVRERRHHMTSNRARSGRRRENASSSYALPHPQKYECRVGTMIALTVHAANLKYWYCSGFRAWCCRDITAGASHFERTCRGLMQMPNYFSAR